MSHDYFRPVPMTDPARRHMALPLAGGWGWFDTVEVLRRGAPGRRLAAADVPDDMIERLTAPRAPIAGLTWSAPRLMGILNVTPDSFSDGGRFDAPDAAGARARTLIAEGADILDIGGESTRPGAAPVSRADEIARVLPVIQALCAAGGSAGAGAGTQMAGTAQGVPISIDTRKAAVARAALDAGASMINDVSAMAHDAEMVQVAAGRSVPICLMHAQGSPQTMQDAPHYDDVLLDVYDELSTRVRAAVAAGIDRARIVVDPGIGFGKTRAHNLRLLQNLSLFHGLGCVVLLGASRKSFIGAVSDGAGPDDRLAGSLAVALHAARQGVQILRVHDVAQTRQALDLFQAIAF